MFDTGEQIESGISNGTLCYTGGNKKGTIEEIIDYLNSIGIEDLSPEVKPTKLKKSGENYYRFFVDFDTKNINSEVHKKYNYESYIDFKNWYKKIFNLELDSNDAFDHNFYEMEISLDDIDKNKEQIQLKIEKFKVSENHKKDYIKEFKKNVIDVAENYKKEFEDLLEARTNKMDKLFFPNELKEPFKKQKIEMVNGEFCLTMPIKNPVSYDPYIKDNKSFFGKNEKGYYIGTSTELKESFNFYYYFEPENPIKMKFKIYKTFNEFMEATKELFDKEIIENPINFKLLKDFFESNFEKIKIKANNEEFVNDYLEKSNFFKLIRKKSKNGKEFINYKTGDIILSIDPKNPNILKRWNTWDKEEYPSIKSSVIYKKLAKENNFKLNKNFIKGS